MQYLYIALKLFHDRDRVRVCSRFDRFGTDAVARDYFELHDTAGILLCTIERVEARNDDIPLRT